MTRVTVDAETSAKLSSFYGRVELCDTSGRTLGYFQPGPSEEEKRQILDACPYTDEELKQFRQVKTGRPLADILKDLRN